MEVQAGAVENSHRNRYEASPYTHSHIAYHFLIGKDGTIKKNRRLSEDTPHTGCGLNEGRCKEGMHDINENSIAIALAGDFNFEYPTKHQVDSLRYVVTELQKKYGIPNERVIPHKKASATSCPGAHLEEMLWK